jgi:mRNA interferase HigB
MTHASDCCVYLSGLLGFWASGRLGVWERYPDAEQPLKAWYEEATSAGWSQPADINGALPQRQRAEEPWRGSHNIKGNDYRLIVAIAYKLLIFCVKFVGTHKEHDAVDAETAEVA